MNQKLSTMTKIPFIRLTIKRANRRKVGSKTLIFELKSVYVINAIIHSTGRYPCDQQHLDTTRIPFKQQTLYLSTQ